MPVHRCISIAFLFALAGLTNAQGPAASRWSLGVDMGAGAAYRTLVSTVHTAEHDQHIAWRDDKDRPSLALGAQAGVGYRLSSLIGLEGGVG